MGAPRKYPLELRERAVRLALESGRSIRQVALDLGIHHEALRVWVRRRRLIVVVGVICGRRISERS